MYLVRLKTEGFRNLGSAEIRPARINFVIGNNGAGKTSLLEAIYLLNRGRSFRTSQLDICIRLGEDRCHVFGEFRDGKRQSRVGMERYRQKDTQWRMDGRTPGSVAELAQLVPLMLITPETLSLVSGTPQLRRQFMDAGMFHVEHHVWSVWRRWRLALRNRNSLLKSGRIDSRQLSAWTDVLVETSEALTTSRSAFVKQLDNALKEDESLTESLGQIELNYQFGWPRELSYRMALEQCIERDLDQGYTSVGPHKADLMIRVNGEYLGARRFLSRGQQKMVAVALELARLRVVGKVSGQSGIVLVDDVAAELDYPNQKRLLGGLLDSGAQLFITALTDMLPDTLKAGMNPDMDSDQWKMFHVEHGQLREPSNKID